MAFGHPRVPLGAACVYGTSCEPLSGVDGGTAKETHLWHGN